MQSQKLKEQGTEIPFAEYAGVPAIPPYNILWGCPIAEFSVAEHPECHFITLLRALPPARVGRNRVLPYCAACIALKLAIQ
jgi:hypothetical protein